LEAKALVLLAVTSSSVLSPWLAVAHMMQGAVRLVTFAAFLFLALVP
jgi:hypothetical protein